MSTTSLIAVAATPMAVVTAMVQWLGIAYILMVTWLIILAIFSKQR